MWGGGSVDGPTRDGFDSAGLTFFAVSRGTDGKVVLPRTADEQWSIGKELPLDQVQPGDLVFSGWDVGTLRLGESSGTGRSGRPMSGSPSAMVRSFTLTRIEGS